MKTVYIDVYFMINFTVDILASFVSLRMIHAKTSIKRLILVGLVGGLFAVAELFIVNNFLHIITAASFVLLISYIACSKMSIGRRIRYILLFYVASFLISGAVTFIYRMMDEYLDEYLGEVRSSVNRKMLIFSLIILLVIGGLRLFVMLFSDSVKEKSARIIIEIDGRSMDVEALIDTGNLVKDPMNMNPVIFVKRSFAEKIFPQAVIELCDIDGLEYSYRKRVRLIPVTKASSTHVMTGIRVDKVIICGEKEASEIDATIVIDKEEGTFGGYYALTPYVAVDNYE